MEEKKVVHRDIKLENILLVDENDNIKVKMGDFGLASKVEKIDTKVRCGTPGYVAPEVLL